MASTLGGDGISLDQVQQLLDVVLDSFLQVVAVLEPGPPTANGPAARLGGDEFAVVCEDLGSVRAARLVAERIRAAIVVPVPLQHRTVTITASVGVAVTVAGKASVGDLFRTADREMYLEKAARQGRPNASAGTPTGRD